VRVAIDVSALSGGLVSGTAVYLYRLCEALASAGGEDRFDLLYNGMPGKGEELARSLERGRASVTVARLRWPLLPGPLFDRPYPGALHDLVVQADVFHVGEFVYPRPRSGQAVVATVHDVTTRLFPQWHNFPNRVLHERRLGWIARHATRVIVDAEATRRDTAAQLGVSAARLDVVPLARGTGSATTAAAAATPLRERWRPGQEPYVLFVGTLEPRKNLTRLVEAFGRLPADLGAVRLVLGGAWGWRTRRLREAVRGLGRRVAVTGALEPAALEAWYAGATVFAYPSLYEGFGLPVLEAMAAGVPVVTSRGGALEEVAGGAAMLVDPLDVGGIAAALERLLRSPEERERLRALGREREREFTWERTARLTLDVYRRAVGEAA
jgi:alpha-1,3-rhamnosyl/mannosyltransferase